MASADDNEVSLYIEETLFFISLISPFSHVVFKLSVPIFCEVLCPF